MTISIMYKLYASTLILSKESFVLTYNFHHAIKIIVNYLTSQEAAEKLGISIRRLQALVKSERLPATRFGRALMIKESDLRLVENRKPGRPPKSKKETKKAGVKQE